MRSAIRVSALIGAVIILGGCAGGAVLDLIKNPKFPNRDVCVKNNIIDQDNNIKTSWLNKSLADPMEVNKFLDCVVADLKTSEYRDLSDNDKKIRNELFLYRGHIVVTLLARYGAFNVTGKVGSSLNINYSGYDRAQGDAASILTRIEEAEVGLRGASNVTDLPGGGKIKPGKVPTVRRLHRVAEVIQVAVAVERPTARRARNFVERVIAAVGGSVPSGLEALKDAVNGIKKLTVLKFFTRAYLVDAKGDLDRFMSNNTMPDKSDWADWSELLNETCDRLADFAGGVNHCTP